MLRKVIVNYQQKEDMLFAITGVQHSTVQHNYKVHYSIVRRSAVKMQGKGREDLLREGVRCEGSQIVKSERCSCFILNSFIKVFDFIVNWIEAALRRLSFLLRSKGLECLSDFAIFCVSNQMINL